MRKFKSYFIDLIYQAYKLHCVLNPYIKLLLTLVRVACLYRRYQIPLPKKTKLSNFYLHSLGNWYSFQTQLHHPQCFCYVLTVSWENLCCGIPQLGTWLSTIHISEDERAHENVRDYYDDEKKGDFSAILDANNTNMFTNILKINWVFKRGSQYNPQWQSASL